MSESSKAAVMEVGISVHALLIAAIRATLRCLAAGFVIAAAMCKLGGLLAVVDLTWLGVGCLLVASALLIGELLLALTMSRTAELVRRRLGIPEVTP